MAGAAETQAELNGALRKVSLRLLPFVALLYFLAFLVKKAEFGKMIIIIGFYGNGLFVFPFPFGCFRPQPPFGQVSIHYGVYSNSKIAMFVGNQITKILFNFIFALTFWLPFSDAASFAIVGGVLLLLAGAGAFIGMRIMKKRRPSLDRSVASIKEDVRWARDQMTS